jgi:5-bromo-4-chloroindolyl phosphate hydrolysis protein
MVSSSDQIPDPDNRPVTSREFQRSLDQVNARIDDVNKRIDDLRSDFNKRIDDLRSEMKSGQAWMRWGIGLMLALTLTLMGLVLSGAG